MVIGLIVLVLFNVFPCQPALPAARWSFSDFLKRVESGEVKEVLIRGKSVTGKLGDGSTFGPSPPTIPTW
jgi:cell division protease FtsH